MILTVIAAFLGTVAFSILYHVPVKHHLVCGLMGAAGWLVYSLCIRFFPSFSVYAIFASTAVVALLSRAAAVRAACPVTVFLITGIIPLVPGADIYWTAYYFVTSQMLQAAEKGYAAIKTVIAIVLAIVFVMELPQKLFNFPRRS